MTQNDDRSTYPEGRDAPHLPSSQQAKEKCDE
jgi:hypothetical protein